MRNLNPCFQENLKKLKILCPDSVRCFSSRSSFINENQFGEKMRVRCNVLLKQKGKLFSSRKLCLLKILRSEAQETTSPKKGN